MTCLSANGNEATEVHAVPKWEEKREEDIHGQDLADDEYLQAGTGRRVRDGAGEFSVAEVKQGEGFQWRVFSVFPLREGP